MRINQRTAGGLRGHGVGARGCRSATYHGWEMCVVEVGCRGAEPWMEEEEARRGRWYKYITMSDNGDCRAPIGRGGGHWTRPPISTNTLAHIRSCNAIYI